MAEKKGKEKEIREPGKTRKPGEGEPSNPPKKDDGDKPKDENDAAESAGDVIDPDVHARVVAERDEARTAAEETTERLKGANEEIEELRAEAPQEGVLVATPGMLVTPGGHALGWKPSLPDFHDVPADVTGIRVMEEVDPRDDMPVVYDQGQLGSCTANAIAAAVQYDKMLDDEATDVDVPSRLFIYYMERQREGTITTDAGAFGRDGFKSLRKIGAPDEDFWPYDIERFAEKPDDEAFEEAGEFKIGQYVHPGLGQKVSLLERREAFQRLLSNKQTIAFGFTVYESFEGAWGEPGVMPLPVEGEKVLGGHEVLMVGYLSEWPEHVLCRNSWGDGWGIGGYFLMPWQFACNPAYSGDWRSIYRALGA